MAMDTVQKKERQYYIDWLRILLILSVFLFHIGMIFNSWDWHVKNDVTYGGGLRHVMIFLHYWRMPLLFLISGAGTFYALGKRTPSAYLGERLKRLVIPLFAGIFILVPVQVYVERSSLYTSLWDYYPHMFEGVYPSGNFSWHHLWFIAYLFVISLFISPWLNFMRSNRFENFKKRLGSWMKKPLALNLFMIPILLSQAVLRPYFPDDTHALVDDWAAMSFYIIFFLSGFILLSNRDIVESMRRFRSHYLAESALFTLLLFTVPRAITPDSTAEIAWHILSCFVAWSTAMAAIGFARHYLNKDHRLRKYANEGIYPFYLLHQPVIVVIASIMVSWDLAVTWKVILITVSSFSLTAVLYWYLVRPFNFMRIIFGMKSMAVRKKVPGKEPTVWIAPSFHISDC